MAKYIYRYLLVSAAIAALPGVAHAQTTDSYEYDALGRLVKVTTEGGHNDGHVGEYSYDAAGNRLEVSSTGSPPFPGFLVSGASASEGGPLVFTVTLADPFGPATVHYATADGSAVAGSDYTAASGTLSFAAGETSKTVSIETLRDLIGEGDETLELTLSAPAGATIRSGSVTGTIVDVAPGSFAIANGTANEGSALSFTVTRTGDTSGAASVGYASADGTATAPGDYAAVSGTLDFAPGETSKTITVDTAADSVVESSETMQVTLSSASGAVIGTASASGTIADVPLGGLSIADTSASEGGALVFTVTRTGATNMAASVNYASSDGTALAGADYTAASGTLNFAAGETSRTITVTTTNDALVEGDETVRLTLSSPSGALINTASATGTITDVPPSHLAITGASGSEGGTVVFTVTRTGATDRAASVNYASSNLTATAPGDYTAVSGTLSFAAGETSKTITVDAASDLLSEGSETFRVTLSSPTDAVIDTATADGTITNVAPDSLAVAASSASEGSPVIFTVTRTGAATGAVTVNYATSNLTAGASDYTATSGTLSFAPGETSKTISVTTANDLLNESDETFRLTLSAPTGAVLDSGATMATGTIVNVAPDSLAIAPSSASEGSPVVFTVTRTGAATGSVTVNYATSNLTAGASDYTAASGTLSFAPGETSKTISVTTATDLVNEGDETFRLTLSAPTGAVLGTAMANGTITNVAPDSLAVTAGSASEGDPLVFTVTRTGAATGTVTVNYATSNGTASSASDYTATSGTLTFAPGEMSKTVSVPTTSDSLSEGDETVKLTLSSPVGAGISTATATGTIVNLSVISVSNASAVEGGSLGFTVSRSAPTTAAVTVNYATSDGTATAGSDYTATSGTLTIPAGQTQATISVPLAVDTATEGNETLQLTLSAPTGGVLGTAVATGTIGDVGILSVANATANEGANLVFTVTRSGGTSGTATVNYATSNGTAVAGSDYTAASGTLTFTSGQTSKTISIPLATDTLSEGSESLQLTLSSPTGALLGNASATGTINDVVPVDSVSVAISGSASVEEGQPLTFVVTRSGWLSTPASIDYATVDESATAGSDYTAVSGTLNFAVGESSKTVVVNTLADTTHEGGDTLRLTLSSPVGTSIGTVYARATIVDPYQVFVLPSSVAEGGMMSFMLSTFGGSNGPITLQYETIDGTAVAGSDYVAASGTITFSTGTTIKVQTLSDGVNDSGEGFSLRIFNVTGAQLITIPVGGSGQPVSTYSVTGTIN